MARSAIPLAARREVAIRYGCEPGCETPAACFYCGAEGRVQWMRRSDGAPSYWVNFPGLELDHFHPARLGGGHDQLVLACRPCNRSKKDKTPATFLAERYG